MNLDFPRDQFNRAKVQVLVKAYKLTRDQNCFATTVTDANGIKVYRVVLAERGPLTALQTKDRFAL